MSTRTPLRPKKSLSQNFLVDRNISHKIAGSLQPLDKECIIEIGPGTGALTRDLLPLCSYLVCVELDTRAVERLQVDFAAELQKNMTLLHADFLKTDLQSVCPLESHGLSVIGNIPYAISSGILFHLFDNAVRLRRSVLMMQKEVARRLVAQPRTKDYGILTLAAAMTCKVRLLFDVKPGSFFPQPAVTSTVVCMDFLENPIPLERQLTLRSLIRAAFGQRRKTLRNALNGYVQQTFGCDLRSIESDYWDKRAEELSLTDFQSMLQLLESSKKL